MRGYGSGTGADDLWVLPNWCSAKVYRIGILTLAAAGQDPTAYWQPFIDELRELNYVPGRNVVIRYSGADARPERLPGLVGDMVKDRVDIIITTAVQETHAAKAATSSIPIVMTLVTDPVGQGLVASLARPGGNVTGLTTLVPRLYQKYVEFLHEVVPSATQFAVVGAILSPIIASRGSCSTAST